MLRAMPPRASRSRRGPAAGAGGCARSAASRRGRDDWREIHLWKERLAELCDADDVIASLPEVGAHDFLGLVRATFRQESEERGVFPARFLLVSASS